MRTLIVAQGLETNRTLAAVSINAPNKVIIIRNTNEVSKKLERDVEKHVQRIKQALTKKSGFNPYPFVFEVTEIHVDFFDVPAAFAAISKTIFGEKANGHEVFADISSGNKTVATALFLACQVNHAPVTYCKAAEYLNAGDQEIAAIAKEPVFIPPLPIQLEELDWESLSKISDSGSVESLSQLLKSLNRETTKSELLSISRKIDRLAEFGYVEYKRRGKKKEVSITPSGRSVARLYS
ncbi:MAG: hypothetical protein JW834_02950 [Candidatus Diapherotrites archaeon]|nr:hypothetical protein [Candidatus Diapherotrites archaeon]